MVSLSAVQTSNARIAATLSTTPVAVSIGATSGIGQPGLLQYSQHTAPQNPRVYVVGRSQPAADEILQQLRSIKPDGTAEYVFIKADVSLLRQVDKVCKQIKEKENAINLLVLSQGTLEMSQVEKLPLLPALSYYSRMRFIANLLPLLRTAASTTSSLSRVITVLAGTKEGPINPSNIPGKKVSKNNHGQISCIHTYPGFVDTGLGRSITGITGGVMKAAYLLMKPFHTKHYIPFEECGDRHVFLVTSSRYSTQPLPQGVVVDGLDTAVGSNGHIGSGVYTVDEVCESADARGQAQLEELRQNGVKEKVWQHLQDEFEDYGGVGDHVLFLHTRTRLDRPAFYQAKVDTTILTLLLQL
ncbi:hypothetical protein PISL3812_00346 [Talaromyces islandicus]|uniref:Uncharacterized protein n=1 Tax=Talaromyces islandicus TaxID=28573 RepID=A0A0U1LJ37_TALIS|nr:hypothetical protein PISL3812_00346 [Talaromyces islandicus]